MIAALLRSNGACLVILYGARANRVVMSGVCLAMADHPRESLAYLNHVPPGPPAS